MHSVFQPSWSWDKVWLKSRSSGGCCSVWWDTKGSSLLPSLPVQLLLQPGSCACLFEARCCAWNTHPISSVTSAEQWGHSGQAQPLLGCLYVQLVAMWALVVAEPLLPIFVARTESLHGVSVHCLCFPRCLRMMLSKKDFLLFMEWWLTAGEGATCAVHTRPLLGVPSLGGQKALQLPCPGGAGATRCDLRTELHSASECLWAQEKGAEPIRSLPCCFHVQNSRTEINLS